MYAGPQEEVGNWGSLVINLYTLMAVSHKATMAFVTPLDRQDVWAGGSFPSLKHGNRNEMFYCGV